MRSLIKIIGIILFVLPCYSEENYIDINSIDRLISEENKTKVENYLLNELLNGINISGNFYYDKNDVIDFYGIPLEETIEVANFFRSTFGIIAERKLIYDDLIFIYFVFENNSERLQRVEINRPLERLKTINIGDNANKIREEFGNIFWESKYRYEHEILFRLRYNGEYPYDLVFLIENNIIIKIECNYFYLE